MGMMEQRVEVGNPKDREENSVGKEAFCLGFTWDSTWYTVGTGEIFVK